jgi:hypothetical protein
MTSDDHPKPEQRGLQTVWVRVQESADALRRTLGDLPERLPNLPAVAMPSIAGLTWRDWFLFGCTGASILAALVTFAIVVSDMLGRG